MSNATHQTPGDDTRFTIGGATIERVEGVDGLLIRFTFEGQTCTGTPAEFGQALADFYGKTVVIPVGWLPMDGRDWVRYPDADVVAVSSHLDDAGRERALTEAGVR